jgi:hypothetical protein
MKIVNLIFVKKLQKFDEEYFDKEYFDFGTPTTNEETAYLLATYMFDRDMLELSEDTWNTFEKIKKVFGAKMKEQVLKNLCTRNHDT